MLSKFPSPLLVVALIASLLGNQCLCAVHAHAQGLGSAEAADHSSRPHVHLGSSHTHGHGGSWHSHGPPASQAAFGRAAKKRAGAIDSQREHDADAFYLASGVGINRSVKWNASRCAKEKWAMGGSGAADQFLGDVASDRHGARPPPEISRTGFALYLLHLSILC